MEEQNLDYLEQCAGEGYENLRSEDYQIPFLRVLQSQSTQCIKKSPDYIEGAEPGMFYNNITKELYRDVVRVIPLDCRKIWMEFKPNRGGFVAMHEPRSFVPDTTDFSKWKNPENGNIISEFYNFFCLIADCPEDGIIIVPMSGSTIKQAKSWNSQISYVKLPSGKQASYYSSIWELSTAFFENNKGTWYSIGSIKRVNYASKNTLESFVNPARLSLDSSKVDYKQLESSEEDNVQY